LANIKSQIKRNKQNEKRRINNRNVRGASRTAVSAARASFEEKAPETKELVLKAISELDKAAGKGVIHKNAAARRKGRLMKKLTTFVPVEASEAKATKKKK
jgi:small subunit ribosomal protein S20